MPICQKCKEEFPTRIVYNSKWVDIHNRGMCLKCLPYKTNKYVEKYTKEILEKVAKESDSMAAMMKNLGVSCISGGMHAHLKKRIKFFGVDTSHWNGLGANKGKIIPRTDYRDVLIKRSGIYKEQTNTLLKAVLIAGIEYKCRRCGISKYNDEFIRLQIEHKDGDVMNNVIENLEFLCPNCHSQTKTYATTKKTRNNGGNQTLQKMIEAITKEPEKYRTTTKEMPNSPCPGCGKIFNHKRQSSKFCSHECSIEFARRSPS